MPTADFAKITSKYRNYEIEKLRIVRRPLGGVLDKLASLVGKDPEGKGQPDRYFHLYSEMAIKNPMTGERQVILIERNQTLNAIEGRAGGLPQQHEAINIALPSSDRMTVGDYITNSKEFHKMKGKSYSRYNVRTNNCQQFQLANLEASGLLREEHQDFINQNVEEILPRWVEKIANPLTDTAAKVSDFIEEKIKRKPLTQSTVSSHIGGGKPGMYIE